jgi:hypothetical protein
LSDVIAESAGRVEAPLLHFCGTRGYQNDVEAIVAYDGMEIRLRGPGLRHNGA